MPQFQNDRTGQSVNVQAGQSLPQGPGMWHGPLGSSMLQGGQQVPFNTPYSPTSISSAGSATAGMVYVPPANSGTNLSSYAGKSSPYILGPNADRAVLWLLKMALIVALPVAALMFWRGYLTFDNGSIATHGTPVIQTNEGPAYRRWDMYMEFRNRNIWTRPEVVVPNSHIEFGKPIANATLVCPKGDFTVKGDLIDSRIHVPNGTLTVNGNVSGSFLAARRIVIHGTMTTTLESGTTFTNTGTVGGGNGRIGIPASKRVVESLP